MFTVKREFRLRRSADFERVRASGQARNHPLLGLYAAPNEHRIVRVGISVSRRVGKAVVRNRVRRRLREAVRLCHGSLRPGFDLVFIARPAAALAGWVKLREAVRRLLQRAGLYPAETGRGPLEVTFGAEASGSGADPGSLPDSKTVT